MSYRTFTAILCILLCLPGCNRTREGATWIIVTAAPGSTAKQVAEFSTVDDNTRRELTKIVSSTLQLRGEFQSPSILLSTIGADSGDIAVGPLWVERRDEGIVLKGSDIVAGGPVGGQPLMEPVEDVGECHQFVIEFLMRAMDRGAIPDQANKSR